MEQKTQICRMCGRERDIEKFCLYKTKTLGLSRQKICVACRAAKGRAKIRLEFLEAFGWKCSCCSERHAQFLTLEHIKGNGKGDAYRAKMGLKLKQSYMQLYQARREGWDRTKYEALCMNCNWAKGRFGQCPHRLGITSEQYIETLRKRVDFKIPREPRPHRGQFVRGFDGRRKHELPEAIN